MGANKRNSNDVILTVPDYFRQSRCKSLLFRTIKDENGCMIWQGPMSHNGYGVATIFNKSIRVHRFIAFSMLLNSYEERSLHIRKEVLHTCDTPACINPEHLLFGTHADNMTDAYNKGRLYRPIGETNSLAKLTEDKVTELRERYKKEGLAQKTLAKLYGTTQANISAVILRKSWTHV